MRILKTLGCIGACAVFACCTVAAEPEFKEAPIDTIFGQGVVNPYSQFFTGTSHLNNLVDPSSGVSFGGANVTFEPCTRTYWHSHSSGQVLFVLAGEGRHQIRGQQIDVLKPGDVIVVPPNTEHWHGAAPDSWMTHAAFSPEPETNTPTWLEPVTDEEYNGPVAEHK